MAGVGMDGVTAVVEHLDLRQEETSHWQQGQCPGPLTLLVVYRLGLNSHDTPKTFYRILTQI